MATPLSALITDIRSHMIAPIDGDNADEFWSDAELVSILNRGVKDLWRAINDDYQNYFLTVDKTHVSLEANSDLLVGVPADVSIVRFLGPRNPATFPYIKFEYRNVDHKDYVAAETQAALDPSQLRLAYFYISQAGAPVAAPEIHIAPLVNASVPLKLAYVPTLASLLATDINPIPGESDNALIAWGVAWARAKEREDRSPDPAWLQMYATEKQNILIALAPRQTQDEEVVEALFEEYLVMPKSLKIATYNLGEKGVVITKSPVHGEDGELAQAQNAVPNPEGGIAGIHKRIGFRALNPLAANGPILSFISAALVDPGMLPIAGGQFGRYLYTADAGLNWKYLSVYFSVKVADRAFTKVGSDALAFLQADDGGMTGQIALDPVADENVWDATALPAAGYDQGRVPFVIPKCLSIAGTMYYWTNATGAVRSFDGATDAAAWDLAVTAVLDWCTDGTSVYVLVTEADVQRVYAVLLSDYSSAQLGADLDFAGQCIECFDGKLYVGGKRPGDNPTTATAVIVSMSVGGGAWAVELEEGDYIYWPGNKSYAFFGGPAGGNVADGDTVTTGSKVYTFQSVLTNVDGNVLRGATLAASLANLAAAIGRSAGAGVTYAASTTANLFVSAFVRLPEQLSVGALVGGPAGDSIPVLATGTAAWWYGEGTVETDHLKLGSDPGTVLTGTTEFTDLVGSGTVLWASKSGTGGMSTLKKLDTGVWTAPRTMPQPFGYVAILADAQEALFLETPAAIALHISKAVKVDAAWFFLTGTGDVSASEITVVALLDGALQRIEMPA